MKHSHANNLPHQNYLTFERRAISVCDTTLRDGEQACGVVFTKSMKIEIAQILDELGVDYIDAGFPSVSENEKESVAAICELGLKAKIVACCRPIKQEIDIAQSCGVDGIFTFIPTSEIHMRAKFEGSIGEIKARLKDLIVEAITHAKSDGLYVGFGAEDATRTNPDYLLDVLILARDAGADLIAPADTAGIMTPEKMFVLTSRIREEIKGVTIAMHCHNDFGLAVANTIAGVKAGANQIQCTINGIGERAGNASLDEAVISLSKLYQCDTHIKYDLLTKVARLIEKFSGITNSFAKPIVGSNAFSHESGIHVSSVLKDPRTYEPFTPELVGQKRKLIAGKHSGKALIRHILEKNLINASDDDVELLLRRIKETAEKSRGGIEEKAVLDIYNGLIASHNQAGLCS